MSSFSPIKTAQQPLNLMKYSPKLNHESSSSSKSSVDLFNSSTNQFKPDSNTLIDFIKQCYLPQGEFASVSDKLKTDLLMASGKQDQVEDNYRLAETNKLNQLNELNQIKNELNLSNHQVDCSNMKSSESPHLDQQQSSTTKLDANTNFLSKLAKETSSNFANFSIEAILASRRKHLTELAHLSDPFTNTQFNSQLNNQLSNHLNTHLNHLQNYQHYQQANLLQPQQFFNHHNSTNNQPILNLHSQLFNLAAAAANGLTNLEPKFHNSPALQTHPTIPLPQFTSTTPTKTLSNGSSLSNETQSSLANMVNNDCINKFTDDSSLQLFNPNQLISNGGQLGKIKISRKKCFNRGPRIPFSGEQICILEQKYRESQYLSSFEVMNLSKQLNLTEARIWYQNRRARQKRLTKMERKNE